MIKLAGELVYLILINNLNNNSLEFYRILEKLIYKNQFQN
jgi:hypothetical protein